MNKNNKHLILILAPTAVAYASLTAIGTMAIRGEIAVDPMLPTIGLLAITAGLIGYSFKIWYRVIRPRSMPGSA